MAFTRKMLKALGIDDEKIDQIIDAHSEVVDGLKSDRDRYKGDSEKLEGVQRELDDLKAKGDDGYKSKYEAEKQAHEELKADIANQKAYAEKESAYRELLRAAGIKEKFINTIIRADKAVIDGLTLGDDGKIPDAETLTENARQNWGDFVAITTTHTAGKETPPANNGAKMSRADLYKKDERGRYLMSTAERQKVLAQNPDLMN